MVRIWAVLALALAVTACTSRSGTPDPVDARIETEIVAFEPGGFAPGEYAALSTEPIDFRAFASWYAGADLDSDAEVITPGPGSTLVAVTGMTGCRTPESIEVRRVGEDLRVEFVGGVDHEECVRAVGPTAVLELSTEDVRGVRTVNGERPLDPAGPGTLDNFVKLGTEAYDDVAPAELGATEQMAARFADRPDALAALSAPAPAGHRGFAFVRGGCAATGAVLLVSHEALTAELTGGEQTSCEQQEYFLVTFMIPDDNVPPGAVPR